MNKRVSKHILIGLIAVLLLIGLNPRRSYADAVRINKTKATILVSQSVDLFIVGRASGVKWSSSNKKVAKVSKTGKVTGKKAGKATIKAKVGSKTYKCKVTVKIGLSKNSVALTKGGTTTIKLCGSKIKKVKTSNKKVATITKKGKITAVGIGNATITVTGKNKKKYKCKVTVTTPKKPSPKTTYYQVRFDSDGGTAVKAQKVQSGKKASVPDIPSRDGFIFDHWDLNGSAYDFNKPVTTNITLKAKWGSGNQTWDNAKEVKQVIDVTIAPGVQTETQAIGSMEERGFSDYPVSYDYTMDGQYCDDVELVSGSSEERPRYYTYYLSDNGDAWTIYTINGAFFAYPVSFNLESELGVETLVSESALVTSYDSETNKYIVTIPDASGLNLKIVDKIDANTLNSLTFEELNSR